MEEKIHVLGLEINNMTSKDAMKKVMSYMETEPVNVIEMITMNTVSKFQGVEDAGEIFESFDITLASDKAMLEAVGVCEERRLKDVEELIFIKMILRYLHKNRIRVLLLAEAQTDLQKLIMYMQEDYENIQIIETATMEEQGTSDDMLLNLVNGAEVDCVLSVLPSPMEERFIYKNKSLVNVRIWLGLGNVLEEMKKNKSRLRRSIEFLMKQFWKKEIAKKGENA